MKKAQVYIINCKVAKGFFTLLEPYELTTT
jgi:hypothetical protein